MKKLKLHKNSSPLHQTANSILIWVQLILFMLVYSLDMSKNKLIVNISVFSILKPVALIHANWRQ